MIWLALLAVLVALVAWGHAIQRFLADRMLFDMTSASAFDRRWLNGALAAGLAVGLGFGHWSYGVGAAIAAFFANMLIKPQLEKMVLRQREKGPPSAPPKSGFQRYLERERDVGEGNDQ